MHRHTAADVHITIVGRGPVQIHGPEIGDQIYQSGAVIDFAPGYDHEIVGLAPDTRVVNIIKG